MTEQKKKKIFENPKIEVVEMARATKEDKKKMANLFKTEVLRHSLEEARNKPMPIQLFGELWHENEICILFADTGSGKTILAVQIAESIASGRKIGLFKNPDSHH